MHQSITERYITASNATSLVADADSVRGNVDVLIAAGWSKADMGTSLLRLVSEFDAVGKRRGVLHQHIDSEKSGGATNLLASKLPSLYPCVRGVEMYARKCGIESPREKAAAVVLHWLDATCKVCEGRKFQRIPNSPALSERTCKGCKGGGVASLPFEKVGRLLENYIHGCIQSAQGSMKKRLHRT